MIKDVSKFIKVTRDIVGVALKHNRGLNNKYIVQRADTYKNQLAIDELPTGAEILTQTPRKHSFEN